MKIVITGLEMAQGYKDKWQRFLAVSGVQHVKSGWIESERDLHRDTETFTAYFDSSYWTGVGFGSGGQWI